MHGGIEEEGVSVLQCYSVSVYQLGYVRCTVGLVGSVQRSVSKAQSYVIKAWFLG